MLINRKNAKIQHVNGQKQVFSEAETQRLIDMGRNVQHH